eukprot:jgi/Mesen1/2525/ME000160S01632
MAAAAAVILKRRQSEQEVEEDEDHYGNDRFGRESPEGVGSQENGYMEDDEILHQLTRQDTFVFNGPEAIYDWLNTVVVDTVFENPKCGDGVCSYPEEFPGFGRFGCIADCGAMQNVTPVTLRMNTVFESEDAQRASSWNLCLTYPSFLCWYEDPLLFSGPLVNSFDQQFIIPDGSWVVVINAPTGGVDGKIDMVEPPAPAEEGGNTFVNGTAVLNSWGSCRPRNESRLDICRSTCASFAVCTALACDNVVQIGMADIAGDCFKLCNKDPEIVINAYSNITCYDAACALNDTSSFLGVYKDITFCHPNPLYDGRPSSRGVQGLAWSDSGLTGFTGAPRPASSKFCRGGLGGTGRKLLSSGPHAGEKSFGGDGESPCPHLRRKLLATEADANQWSSQVLPDTVKTALSSASNTTAATVPDRVPWLSMGASDLERIQNLQVALARSLYQWPKEPCTCPHNYYVPEAAGPRLGAFMCTYLGGPIDHPLCNYTHAVTGKQVTTVDELNQVVAQAHANIGLSYAQDEQDAFLGVLLNNLASVAKLPPDIVWIIRNRLHESDKVLVSRTWPPGCNIAYTTLDWKKGVNYNTQMYKGDTLQWEWADDEPHSIREVKLGKGPFANFKGVGSGKHILSRTAVCSPENSGFLNITQLPPVPCTTASFEASESQQSTFRYAWQFDKPGVYRYEDSRLGSLMSGTITVVDATDVFSLQSPAELAECAPGCPLWAVGNGQCYEACNVVACDFDGGDCACSGGSCTCFPGQAKSPEGVCCEGQTVGDGLLFDFEMKQFSSPGQQKSSFLPNSTFLKDRIYNLKNRVLIGVLIHQTRAMKSKCSGKRFDNIYNSCLDKNPSLTPFGVDPVFLATSSLYNPTLVVSDFYPDPAQLTPLGVPLGFFHRQAKGYKNGFTIILDINLSHDKAAAALKYLQDGFFIDNATTSIFVQVVTYNGEQQQFTNTEVKVTFQDGGKLAVQTSINSVAMELYHSKIDLVRAVLEAMLFISIVYQLIGELREYYLTMRRTNRILAYFDNSWNFIDLASLALLFVCAILWIVNYVGRTGMFQVEPRYNIYKDLDAEANRWALNDGGLDFDKAMNKMADIYGVIQFRSGYMAINGISLFLIMLRVLKFLDFQPRMGIITRALAVAAPELYSFFLLLFVIFIIYSLQAHLVFGHSLDAVEQGPYGKMSKKAVQPEIATRSLFVRFGVTPVAKEAVKNLEKKKRVNRDTELLKNMLVHVGQALADQAATLALVVAELQELKGGPKGSSFRPVLSGQKRDADSKREADASTSLPATSPR